MKKLISLVIACIITLCSFVGCSDKNNYSHPFVNIRWTRSGDGDTEYIRFSSDGSFSYYCACGNPVNESDLCVGYTYDANTKLIKLKYFEPTDEAVTQIKVIKCTENQLVLEFDGDVRIFTVDKDDEYIDSVTYNGKQYSLLVLTDDVFVYGIALNREFEDNVVYEINECQWDIIAYNAELFVVDSQLNDIISYYSDSQSFTFSVTVEYTNSDNCFERTVSLSDDEIRFFEQIADMEATETVFFENIEAFGTLTKTSNDGLIFGSTDLLYYNGKWYWRTGAIDYVADGWPEFVIPLTETICEKLGLNY